MKRLVKRLRSETAVGRVRPGVKRDIRPTPIGLILGRSWRLMRNRRLMLPFLAIWFLPSLAVNVALTRLLRHDLDVLIPGGLILFGVNLLFIGPVTALAWARLGIIVWDRREISLEPLWYGLRNYFAALPLYLIWFCTVLSLFTAFLFLAAPGVLIAGALTRLVFWGSVGLGLYLLWGAAAAVTVWAWWFFLWRRARRVLTFLYNLTVFRKMEGRNGNWAKRYRLVYYKMNFKRHASSLNLILGLVLAYYLALSAYSFFSPELPAWLFTRKAALDAVLLIGQGVFWLWLSVAAAGFYRRNMKR